MAETETGARGGKQREPKITAEQRKVYDRISKPTLIEVYRHFYNEAKPNAAKTFMEDAWDRACELYPDLKKSKASGGANRTAGGRISFALYTTITAISAHAEGMPLALYEKIGDKQREALKRREFVQVVAPGTASARVRVTEKGTAALDAFEAATQKASAAANAGLSAGAGDAGAGAPADGSAATAGAGAGEPSQTAPAGAGVAPGTLSDLGGGA